MKRQSLLERVERMENEVVSRKYAVAVIVRSDEEIEQNADRIGPNTKVIKIVPRQKAVNGI